MKRSYRGWEVGGSWEGVEVMGRQRETGVVLR
jgi:hypothetical protein